MDKIKLLMVDDDANFFLEVKRHLLQKSEIAYVKHASNIEEAKEHLAKDRFDVVILDLIMPNYDGFYFLERVHSKYITPVIMMSACSEEAIIKKAFALGAKYYVIKPFNYNVLYKRIFDVLAYEAEENKGVVYENINMQTV